MGIYDHDCTQCKLHQAAVGKVCLPGYGNKAAKIVVVSRMPDSGRYQEQLWEVLGEVGLDPVELFFTSALKCRNFDQNASNLDVKTCRQYLEKELEILKPDWVLTMGNEALQAAAGHSGITKYRGRVIERTTPRGHKYKVFPTISMANVIRNPGMRQAWMAEMRLFVAQVMDRPSTVPPMKLATIYTNKQLKALKKLLETARLISYDIETTGDNEALGGKIVSLAGTLETELTDGTVKLVTFALPLYHPESPWKTKWRAVLKYIAPAFEAIPKQVAHNGKFDARWLRKFGLRAKVTFDTMLAAHLLDENRQKGLKPQAASRLGVAPWAIETRNLLDTPLADVLKYNAYDTYYTYYIYLQIREELIAQPRLARVFLKIMMPANEKLIEAELRGVWVDRQRLASNEKVCADMVASIEAELAKWVPKQEKAKNWPTYKSGKPVAINYNPSIFSKWLLFDHLKLPVLERGKEKPDGREGDPSMAEAVMLELKDLHPVVGKLLERTGWAKNGQFINSYREVLDPDDRVHTTFKLYGTVTGRLSSGKAELDKVTGARSTRGLNLQQVPRDPFMRGLFGAAPGYMFVEVDFSQVELRVVAYLARERTMLRLYQTGQDIHLATASWVLGIPASKVTKEERKKAKAVNFGFVYGMGARKFVKTAFENYEAVFTLDEAMAIRKTFFQQFSGLLPWHARMRRLVHQNHRVQSPLGRTRHLPDIASDDEMVQGEAERQAINSPVQSFASDMNLIGMVETHNRFLREGIEGHILGTVHDATLWEIKTEHVARALPIIKYEYEHLPLKRKFGVNLDVPIVADIKVGTHWGGATELTPEQVAKFKLTMIPEYQGEPVAKG